MTTAPPSVPDSFMRRLKAYDKLLGLEWLGDHFAVVDESTVVARHKRYREGLIINEDWMTIYDRVYHLKPGQILDGGVINELQRRNMNRWGEHKNYKFHIDKLVAQETESKENTEEDFNKETVSELKKLRNFSVVMPGRKETINGNSN